MKKHLLPESELIAALNQKTRDGAEALYDMYSRSLYIVIFRIVRHQETAKDALQNSFIKIWDHISQYDASRGKLFTWMVNIARNVAFDLLRSKRHKQYLRTGSIDDHEEKIEDSYSVTPNTDTIGIRHLLNELNANQRPIFELIYFGGYTHVEVAEELCIPVGTVKTRLKMGIDRLRANHTDLYHKSLVA